MDFIEVTHIAVVQVAGVLTREHTSATISHSAFGSMAEAVEWVSAQLSDSHDLNWNGAEFLSNMLDASPAELIESFKGEITVTQLHERVWEVRTSSGPTVGWVMQP